MHFGALENTKERNRGTNASVGPKETKQSYAFTSEKRKQNHQKVYSVNIPFSKYDKPGSA